MEKMYDLIKKDFKDYRIIKVIELSVNDHEGKKVCLVGFFRDPNIVDAFVVAIKASGHACVTNETFVLTNGVLNFTFEEKDVVSLHSVEQETFIMDGIKKNVKGRLSLQELKLFCSQ